MRTYLVFGNISFLCFSLVTINLQTSYDSFVKVVIYGKYINLNKITKIKHISLEFNRLLIFVILYVQFTVQNRGTCCLKKCFDTERSKGIFVRENLKK